MTTRKPLVLVSGLFEELNTPTDKLDFAGNTTTDLTEGSNLYYTDVRSRLAISVTDTGGDGSLTYDNTTGVITYTGPSASEVRAHLSAATSGTGFGSLAYDNSTGVFTYSVVTSSDIRQQISVTDTGGDGSLTYDNSTGVITYTGPTSADARGYFSVATGSGLTYNSTTGEFGTSAIPNAQLANSSFTLGTTTINLGDTIFGVSGLTTLQVTGGVLYVGDPNTADSIQLLQANGGTIIFEGTTNNVYETFLRVIDPTADRIITLPDATGTVALLNTLSVAAGSGLTYNSGTGEFGTSAIPNAQLQNSSITLGSTSIALGSTSTSITGLLSVTSAAVITNDNGFRVRNNSDNTKQVALDLSGLSTATTRTLTVPDLDGTILLDTSTLPSDFSDSVFRVSDNSDNTKKLAFECSGISTSTTRTMTVPDENGTISTQDFATAIAVALG